MPRFIVIILIFILPFASSINEVVIKRAVGRNGVTLTVIYPALNQPNLPAWDIAIECFSLNGSAALELTQTNFSVSVAKPSSRDCSLNIHSNLFYSTTIPTFITQDAVEGKQYHSIQPIWMNNVCGIRLEIRAPTIYEFGNTWSCTDNTADRVALEIDPDLAAWPMNNAGVPNMEPIISPAPGHGMMIGCKIKSGNVPLTFHKIEAMGAVHPYINTSVTLSYGGEMLGFLSWRGDIYGRYSSDTASRPINYNDDECTGVDRHGEYVECFTMGNNIDIMDGYMKNHSHWNGGVSHFGVTFSNGFQWLSRWGICGAYYGIIALEDLVEMPPLQRPPARLLFAFKGSPFHLLEDTCAEDHTPPCLSTNTLLTRIITSINTTDVDRRIRTVAVMVPSPYSFKPFRISSTIIPTTRTGTSGVESDKIYTDIPARLIPTEEIVKEYYKTILNLIGTYNIVEFKLLDTRLKERYDESNREEVSMVPLLCGTGRGESTIVILKNGFCVPFTTTANLTSPNNCEETNGFRFHRMQNINGINKRIMFVLPRDDGHIKSNRFVQLPGVHCMWRVYICAHGKKTDPPVINNIVLLDRPGDLFTDLVSVPYVDHSGRISALDFLPHECNFGYEHLHNGRVDDLYRPTTPKMRVAMRVMRDGLIAGLEAGIKETPGFSTLRNYSLDAIKRGPNTCACSMVPNTCGLNKNPAGVTEQMEIFNSVLVGTNNLFGRDTTISCSAMGVSGVPVNTAWLLMDHACKIAIGIRTPPPILEGVKRDVLVILYDENDSPSGTLPSPSLEYIITVTALYELIEITDASFQSTHETQSFYALSFHGLPEDCYHEGLGNTFKKWEYRITNDTGITHIHFNYVDRETIELVTVFITEGDSVHTMELPNEDVYVNGSKIYISPKLFYEGNTLECANRINTQVRGEMVVLNRIAGIIPEPTKYQTCFEGTHASIYISTYWTEHYYTCVISTTPDNEECPLPEIFMTVAGNGYIECNESLSMITETGSWCFSRETENETSIVLTYIRGELDLSHTNFGCAVRYPGETITITQNTNEDPGLVFGCLEPPDNIGLVADVIFYKKEDEVWGVNISCSPSKYLHIDDLCQSEKPIDYTLFYIWGSGVVKHVQEVMSFISGGCVVVEEFGECEFDNPLFTNFTISLWDLYNSVDSLEGTHVSAICVNMEDIDITGRIVKHGGAAPITSRLNTIIPLLGPREVENTTSTIRPISMIVKGGDGDAALPDIMIQWVCLWMVIVIGVLFIVIYIFFISLWLWRRVDGF